MVTAAFDHIRRLKVEEAIAMVELGILREDEPLELLEGVLVEMTPQGPVHADSTALLAEALREAYRGRGSVREEKPIAVDEYNLPEPDIAVVRRPAGSYLQRHPGGPDIVLVVELAASSQDADRQKAVIYARGRVPVYWLLDLVDRKLTVHREPRAKGYALVEELSEEQQVCLPELDTSWPVGRFLPRQGA